MAGGFPQPEAGGAAARPLRSLATIWVHRTPAGVEFGVEQPSGSTRGPLSGLVSAFVIGWRVRKTLWVLVLKEFTSRYRAQALGLVWSFAYPLVMMATITIAFDFILRIPIPNFPIFYLIGAVFWQWFSNSSLAATGTFVDNAGLVKKTTFPRFLLPVASILSNGINFCMEWLLVLAFYFVFPDAYHFNATLLALPVLIGIEFVLLLGVGLMTSTLNVRYRDVFYVVTSILTVGFWATPILYSTAMAPPWLRHVFRLNPLTGVLEGARAILMRGELPKLADVGPGAATALIIFLFGCAVFRAQNLRLADHV
jgi:lipopolysaccharide transport system permease protein